MSVVTPHTMSSWLGIEPSAAGLGLHTGLSAALWPHECAPHSPWDGWTQANHTTHILWFGIEPLWMDFDLDEHRLWSGKLPAYALQLIRAGEKTHARIYDPATIMHVYVPQALLADVAREAGHDVVELVDPRFQSTPGVEAIAQMMLRSLRDDDRLTRLQIDTLGVLLCTELLRHWSSVEHRDAASGRLSPWQKKQALSFLEQHVTHDIGLNDIAAHVGLSRYHFNRAFKQTVGVSPHRYLLLRRLDKAQQLLAKTSLTITAVAARVGYTDPDRLGRLFRNELGVSPTAYRRSRRE